MALLLAASPWLSAGAEAQSITQGALLGSIRDEAGAPIRGVSVELFDVGQGTSRLVNTSANGSFGFPVLQPGDYSLLVERLGYHPILLVNIPVRANGTVRVPVTLRAVQGAVRVDTLAFVGGAVQATKAGQSRYFSSFELDGLATDRRGLFDVTRFSTNSTDDFQTEGLPGRMGGASIDGLTFVPTNHPGLPSNYRWGSALSRGAFGGAELATAGGDVEISEVAGAILTGYGRSGGSAISLRGFADWTGDALGSSDNFGTATPVYSTIRLGASLGGPIVPDTAFFLAGVEINKEERPVPWPGVDPGFANVVQASLDGYAVDLADYQAPQIESVNLITGFGRFGWTTERHTVTVSANIGSLSATDPGLDPDIGSGFGAGIDGVDLVIRGGLASRWGNNFAQELRIGFESSERDYTTFNGPISTTLASGFQPFGTSANLPGIFKTTVLRASETLHYISGSHSIKFGGAVTLRSFDESFVHGRRGEFFFSDAVGFQNARGLFVQAESPSAPVATFGSVQLAGYLQDTWSAAPGLELVLGVRYENEAYPTGEITTNQQWLLLTGLDNAMVDGVSNKFSPRFSFTFMPGASSDWVVRGDAGVYYGLLQSSLLSEVITHSGAINVRRGVGDVSGWPSAPSAANAPITGPRLALLGPKLEAPRSVRMGGGISRAIDAQTALHVSASYRHTDFLVRRADLNRNSAVGTDQHGRSIYGTLVKEGQLVAAQPATNRRFPSFDLVSALNPDGFSDYTDFTVSLERTLAATARVFASYTFSKTTDNWLGGRGGGPDDQLSPFPDSLKGIDWADGVSDFDIPHRFLLGAELGLPVGNDSRITAFVRRESGRPFTPGYRDGVDANGDGSGRNDVAFVDQSVTGVTDLFADWDCLQSQVGQFAERNVCRMPSLTRVDVSLRFGLAQISGNDIAIVIDALNLTDPEDGIPDRALYVIDPTGTLQTDPVSGSVTVPLIANPNFGAPIVRRGFGRVIRVGARVNY